MMLAFFVDQAQQLCCKQFQQAWAVFVNVVVTNFNKLPSTPFSHPIIM
jgi:hypothetical protein